MDSAIKNIRKCVGSRQGPKTENREPKNRKPKTKKPKTENPKTPKPNFENVALILIQFLFQTAAVVKPSGTSRGLNNVVYPSKPFPLPTKSSWIVHTHHHHHHFVVVTIPGLHHPESKKRNTTQIDMEDTSGLSD